MNKRHLCTLTQRLDRLERENRWWRALGIVSVAVLGLVFLVGATEREVADEIWAKRIVLVDEAGRVRIAIGMKPDETPALTLYNKDGKRGATLDMHSDNSSALSFYDKDGNPTILLTGNKMDGSAAIIIAGKDGKGLASLIVDSKGALGLDISDKDGERRIWFGLAADGSPRLVLFDKDGQERTALGHSALESTRTGVTEQRPASSLVLFNKDGKVIWKAP